MSSYGRGRGDENNRYSNRNRGFSGTGRLRSQSPTGDDSRGHMRERHYHPSRHGQGRGGGSTIGQGNFRGQSGINDQAGWLRSSLPNLPEKPSFPTGTGQIIPYPTILPHGSQGEKILLLANHYEILTLPIIKIYQYSLSFRIPESSQLRGSEKATANQIARALLSDVATDFMGPNFVFDGVSIGWSPDDIGLQVGEDRVTTVTLGRPRKDGSANEILIQVRSDGPANIRELVNYLAKRGASTDVMGSHIGDILNMIGCVFRNDPQQRMLSRNNSNAFFPKHDQGNDGVPIGTAGLVAVKGIYQALQVHFGRITLNVDVCTSVWWPRGKTLLEIVCQLRGCPEEKIEQVFLADPGHFFHATGRLLGIFFEVRHLKEQEKMRFSAWSSNDADNTTFDLIQENGTVQSTTVVNYFLQKYGKVLKWTKLPLVKTTRYGEIPLEICYTAEGEFFKGALESNEVSDVLRLAAVKGQVRLQHVKECAKQLAWHTLSMPLRFGLTVSTRPLEVKALVLPAPQIRYSNGEVQLGGDRTWSGVWNLRSRRLVKPISIRSWGLICLNEGRSSVDVDRMSSDIQRAFGAVGITLPRGSPPSVFTGCERASIVDAIDATITKAKSIFKNPPNLIIFTLPSPSPAHYNVIKQAMDGEFGIPSQVLSLTKAIKGGPQYFANVALKVNVKVGSDGVNHEARLPIFEKRRFMLLGGDISSPGASSRSKVPAPPATAALVGTWDKGCQRYSATTSVQPANIHTIQNFGPMMKALLLRYKERNNGLNPQSLIYYRDGVGESQLASILEEEGDILRELLKEVCGGETKVTIVVAIKRHKTRFFSPVSSVDNIRPGTVVDDLTEHISFYMISHPFLQGTQRPCHYLVIRDENGLGYDNISNLTNTLCSTYARATRSVGVCPPVYYADQACERARLMLRDMPGSEDQQLLSNHADLDFSMYWL